MAGRATARVAPTEGYKGCGGRRDDVGSGPYECDTRGATGGQRRPPLRKRYKRCGAGRNPPVTASPCQPPLGKGARGTGVADCHTSESITGSQ